MTVKPQPIPQLLKRLWHHVSRRRRGQFGLILILTILTSLTEVLSIGAVLPFLAVLSDPARVFELASARPFIQALGFTEPEQLLFPLTIAFGLIALCAGAMRLMLLWININVSYAIGADLSINVYRRTLYQPYAVHVARNSSEVIEGIKGKINVCTIIFNSLLTIFATFVTLTAILTALLYIDVAISLATFVGFGLIYTFTIIITKNRLLINSQISAHEAPRVIKALQEGLGGIRDVLIDGSQQAYCKIFSDADQPLRRALGNSSFISSSPRYVVEALGMFLIAGIAYLLTVQSDDIAKAIPVLGALALGAQRLLPAIQQAYSSWVSIQSNRISIQDALDLLDQPLLDKAGDLAVQALPFTGQIRVKQLAFRYSRQTPWVLKNLNLTILKGSRVGFIGVTGSGKSTLLDILMGLLQPTTGMIEVDGQDLATASNCRAWQAHIAHVPQVIFLADTTIEENIAFGVPKAQIDRVRVRQAAQQAEISRTVESWPKQYETTIGERGVRLSGGQRQRIGIARALYKKADVIIFDEATSALDNDTEQAVMQAIEGLSKDLTLLIIAHRLTTLKNCNQIVELGNGGIVRSGSYQDIMQD